MPSYADHVPFVTSGSYPRREANSVVPLVDGDAAFRSICSAVESARSSAWLTVAFYEADFEMPDGRGGLFDVLDRAQARGVDVRVIFWRHPQLEQLQAGVHFSGTAQEREALGARGSRWLARWDRAHGGYCQHQKSWLIDAGQPGEVAFVGGINLNRASVVAAGHAPTDHGNTHDVYVEIRGPSATDVHHNFVQRWNEASDRDHDDGCWPDAGSQSDLPFPDRLSEIAGEVPVQMQRTVRRDRYLDGTPPPGGVRFDIGAGEFSVVDQYLRAIDAARHTIYIEDQVIASPQVVDALHSALERGVAVTALVPGVPSEQLARKRGDADSEKFWDAFARLGAHDHFALVGIAANRPDGGYQDVYVHAKIALVDDAWCTIGSTNIANRSFYGDTELNASFWHGPTVRALRCELFLEHTGHDTTSLDERSAHEVYRTVARANAQRRAKDARLEGLACALDPSTYASEP